MVLRSGPSRQCSSNRHRGIASATDALEFMIAGATAVQIGTANYYDPTVTMKLLTAFRPIALKTTSQTSES